MEAKRGRKVGRLNTLLCITRVCFSSSHFLINILRTSWEALARCLWRVVRQLTVTQLNDKSGVFYITELEIPIRGFKEGNSHTQSWIDGFQIKTFQCYPLSVIWNYSLLDFPLFASIYSAYSTRAGDRGLGHSVSFSFYTFSNHLRPTEIFSDVRWPRWNRAYSAVRLTWKN